MPPRDEPHHEQKPDGRIKRQVKHEEKRADRRDVADPPERAAEIDQARSGNRGGSVGAAPARSA